MLKLAIEVFGLALIAIGFGLAFSLAAALIFTGVAIVVAMEVHS